MIRILMLDLGDTLVRDNKVLANVPAALTQLSKLDVGDGTPLVLTLVSDFTAVAPPLTKSRIKPVFDHYLGLIDGFGLRKFFRPVDRRITLSTHAGVTKPDRRVYELALRRLTPSGALTPLLGDCLVITENAAHLSACRSYGMSTLQFGKDFTDWATAPTKVQALLAPQLHAAEEATFTESLESHGQLGPAGKELRPGQTHIVDPDTKRPTRSRFSAI